MEWMDLNFGFNEGMSMSLEFRNDLGQYFEVPATLKETLKPSLSLSMQCLNGTTSPNKNYQKLTECI
jgi:hypothetical protein